MPQLQKISTCTQSVGWVTPEKIKFDRNNRDHWLAMKKLAERVLADMDKPKETTTQFITGESHSIEKEVIAVKAEVEGSPVFSLEYPFYIPFEPIELGKEWAMSFEEQRVIKTQQKTIQKLQQQLQECRGEEVGNLLNVISDIREKSGIGHEADLTQLPGLVGQMRNQIGGYEYSCDRA